ncbi:DUF6382 domain-containing protein [Paenibacillus kobensis]|uniref:DUF6382 domain-containing protein n=1 Tax=Paenibacillus kobensis TaxID=59841 RepID=UPI000FD96ED6|nr:DUF6382 domain-containing protein [Paenibacillus kobensis]
MEPYRIDFAMMRGHELILDREKPITREELDAMELQMLRSNSIPFLLPVEWIEIDGNITFRYTIEGKRMLSHQLQLRELTMQDMYACLLAVADALDACKSYLLRPECCLLKDNCLFIGERWDDVFLLYVPILKPEDEYKQSVEGPGAFTSLVMRLASHVKQLDGDGLQLILKQLLDSHGVVRPALRKALLELIEGRQAAGALEPSLRNSYGQHGREGRQDNQGSHERQGIGMHTIQERHDQIGQPRMDAMQEGYGQNLQSHMRKEDRLKEEQMPEQAAWFRRPRADAGPVQPLSQFQARQGPDDMTDRKGSVGDSNRDSYDRFHRAVVPSADREAEEMDGEPLHAAEWGNKPAAPERTKWLASAASAIAAALVWRYGYMNQPSGDRLLICFGATVIIAAAAYIAGWRGSRRAGSAADTSASKEGRYGSGSLNQPPQWSLESRLLERREVSVPVKTERRSRSVSKPFHVHSLEGMDRGIGRYSDDIPIQPAVIRTALEESEPPSAAVSDATVWIRRDSSQPSGGRAGAEVNVAWRLERTARGENEQLEFPIAGSASFLIGRTGGKVHFADEHPGISRVHLEFGSNEEGYTVKDLGSRNGTTLNGSPMIAYKIYKLQSEDSLQLAGSDGPVYTIRQMKEAAGV